MKAHESALVLHAPAGRVMMPFDHELRVDLFSLPVWRLMPDSLVSVIIPCYQQGHFLAEAISSALGQTHHEMEVIVVNDGSTDSTREVALDFVQRHLARVVYLEQENQGQNVARQRGLEAAQGEYCLTLDADDLLEPEAATRCLEVFDRHPEANAVVGNAWIVGADGRSVLRMHHQAHAAAWPEVLRCNPYGVNLGVMTRTASLRYAGGLGLARAGCEDWDTWRRMARCGMRFEPVDTVLGRYRQTGQNHSRNVLNNLDAYLEMLDLAAGDDPCLAGKAVALPVDAEFYHTCRNGRIFHALGMALGYGFDPGQFDSLLARLTEGCLDQEWCVRQFTEGLRFALDGDGGKKVVRRQGKFLRKLSNRLKETHHGSESSAMRAEIIHAIRQVTGRRSLAFIMQRVWEKMEWK